ncbi:MAG TPA: class I SAM-dependent methyltransferase [Devosia sp.]|jgi:SAM-dependent methyltransferase|uniref:class I SAM-dependent methyltransferase n=1 Tax=Devosia sp. TaxID=1871048 RepID=UPI002DDCE998|nr:class I SAM-dependent methyltransferase [Devosia sp.]HEV2513867.1 class I SAM-dependent methyltransferase [Devosia sp.]
MDSLYDDAELYDLVSPPDATMARFYVEAAGGPGRRVLDLACGSGRFTVPLAESGALVVGGDLSETMLARARAATADRGVSADFVQLDMRDFVLGRHFDAIVIAANSLMHLTRRADLDRAFSTIRQHLAPGGRLVFDVFVPSPRLLSLPADQRELLGVFAHPKLGEVTIEETISYDPISQVMRTDWYWSTAERRDFRHTPLELRQIFPQELPLLLEAGGLRLIERFGDFERGPLTAASHRQVCLCMVA